MAILISAPIRTGKTLKCIQIIFEYLNEGRPVYTNIVGIKIPGVFHINSSLHNPFDWRDLPNDAVLVYDEAHEHPAFSEKDLLKNLAIPEFEEQIAQVEKAEMTETMRKNKLSQLQTAYAKALRKRKEEILDIGFTMSMHGHFGIEIVLITQKPTKLNSDVLGNVTLHYVMRRKYGRDEAVIWTFGEAQTTWGKSIAESALDKQFWRYPKHLYKFYVSSEKHNVKKYFPKKYLLIACIPVVLFGYSFMTASKTGFFGILGDGSNQAEAAEIQQAEIVQLSANDPTKIALDKKNAELMGLTYEQYLDLQNPQVQDQKNLALNQNSIDQIANQYKPNNPFDYSYMTPAPVTAHRVFSGCMNGVAYDTQGTILHDAPKDLCKRVMAGDRPFNPYKQPEQVIAYDYATPKENPQISNNANPQEVVEPIPLDQKPSRIITGAHSL